MPPQAEQPLAASLRTYKSPPPKRRDAPSPPPDRTSSSYASRQKASLRRSLSPHAGRQTPPVVKRPEWDASKPAHPSPEHAKRAADALNQAIDSGIRLNGQPSPQRAQHAVTASQTQTGAAVKSELSGDSQAGGISQLRASSRVTESHVAASQVIPGSLHRPARTDAASLSVAPGSNAAQLIGVADTGVTSIVSRPQASKGQVSPTPSPPRFRRLPSSSLLDRPAWASPTHTRAPAVGMPSQASSLKRSAGSRTVTATSERTQTHHTSTGSSRRVDVTTGKTLQNADDCAAQLGAMSHAVMMDRADPQASADSHADIMADAHAHAHAQALQRLQQAVEEYNSSSPHVLVPAAVELTAALRQAAKRPGQPRQSVQDLQLAGLKLKHEAAESPSADVPKSPWPEWVRGAWGSPQAPSGALLDAIASQAQAATAAATAALPGVSARGGPNEAMAKHGEGAPQRAQHDVRSSRAAVPESVWSPLRKTESAKGSRDRLVRRALAEAQAAAARNPSEPPSPRQPKKRSQDKAHVTPPRVAAGRSRASATPPRVAAGRTRASATPPRASGRPSRNSTTPPRAAVTLPRAAKPSQSAFPESTNAIPHNKLQAGFGQDRDLSQRRALKGTQHAGSNKRSWQPTSAAPHAFRGHPEPEIATVQGGQTKSAHQGQTVCHATSVHSRQRAPALKAFEIALPVQPMTVVQSGLDGAAPQSSGESSQPCLNTDDETDHAAQASQSEHNSDLNSNASRHAVLAPVLSMTSVAALRQSFEQLGTPAVHPGDSVKPRNRLPLRKVSSKAHVIEDEGSPQQAALLWQQSLRGEAGGEELHAEHHGEPDQADHHAGVWASHGNHASGAPHPLTHTLYSTVYHMSQKVAGGFEMTMAGHSVYLVTPESGHTNVMLPS